MTTVGCSNPIETVRFLAKIFPLIVNYTVPKAPETTGYCNEYSFKYENSQCFDFVVVGAGSAGCVVANRLSEVAEWEIALLEAGSEEPPVTVVPAVTPFLYNEKLDWGYSTEPDENSCKSIPDGRCYMPRGKVMGGSSSINYMHYLRGNPDDYDQWKQMGNEGWGYNDVLKYFKKSEDNRDEDIMKKYGTFHGRQGYQTVMRYPYTDPNLRTVMNAWNELGLPETDHNSDNPFGVMHSQATSRNGERLSSNAAFVKPIRDRKNLWVAPDSYVTKVLVDDRGDQPKAYGIEYVRNNQTNIILVRKEVILSAGAFNSPKILMLSGIGPKEHLQTVNIPVKKHLPGVGQHIEDHVILGSIMSTIGDDNMVMKSCEHQKQDVITYNETRTGPLSSTGLVELTTHFHTEYKLNGKFPSNIHAGVGPLMRKFGNNSELDENGLNLLSYYNSLAFGLVLVYPKSKGYMELDRNDPLWNAPLIHMKYYSDEQDLQLMIAGAHILTNNLFRTKAMRRLGAKLLTEPIEPCNDYSFGSNDYWRCTAVQYTYSNAHPVGACKMGPLTDDQAVVNPSLQVIGVSNLRVIDTSVIPRIPGGHMHAPALMIGEKASDLVKEDWGINVSFEE